MGESACSTEWVDLLHINYPDKDGNFTSQFIPLTAQEQKDYIAEEEKIAKKIRAFHEGSKKVDKMTLDRIYTEKRKLFEELNSTDDKYGEIFVIYEGQNNYSQLYEARRLGSSQRVYSYVRIKFFKDKIDTSKAYDIPTLEQALSMSNPWLRRKSYAEITADSVNMQTPKKDAQDAKEGNKELQTELNFNIGSNLLNVISSFVGNGGRSGRPSRSLQLLIDGKAKKPFFDMSLLEWKSKPYNTWDINGLEIKADLEAQFYRFAADASGDFKYDLVSQDFTLAGKVSVDSNFLRGVGSFKTQWPQNNDDTRLIIPYYLCEEAGSTVCKAATDESKQDPQISVQELDCGYFKVEATGKLEGKVGASLILCAEINADMKAGIPILKGYHTTNPNGEDAVYGHGKLFMGLEGGAELHGELKWCDDLSSVEGEWKQLAKLGVTGTMELGGGIDGDFKITNQNGRYTIQKKARKIWGFGADGTVDCEVDKANLWTLFRFMYRNLMEVDYQRMVFIDDDAFNYWTSSVIYYAAMGVQKTDILEYSTMYKELKTFWAAIWRDKNYMQIVDIAINICVDLTNPNQSKILYSPP